MLKTERLVLKHLCLDDAVSLFESAQDEEIGYWCGWKRHESVEETKYVIDHILNKPYCFGIFIEGYAVGVIEIRVFSDNEKEGELGFWIGRPYWNKGYMTEACEAILDFAFNKLTMEKIYCAYFDGNDRSRRVQQKIGFSFCYTEQKSPNRISFVNVLSRCAYLAQAHK